MARQNTLHCYNSKVDHPALLPSNNGNGGQRNHDQTFTKNFLLPQEIKKLYPLHKSLILPVVLIQRK